MSRPYRRVNADALDENAGFDIGEEITIPAPKRSSYRRGLNSDKNADAPTSYRFSKDEKAVMKAAAEALQMKESEYVRWVMYFASNEIVKKYIAWSRKHKR